MTAPFALKCLQAEPAAGLDADAWESPHGSVSGSFSKPETGRIAVKVINRLDDEVMKVVSLT